MNSSVWEFNCKAGLSDDQFEGTISVSVKTGSMLINFNKFLAGDWLATD